MYYCICILVYFNTAVFVSQYTSTTVFVSQYLCNNIFVSQHTCIPAFIFQYFCIYYPSIFVYISLYLYSSISVLLNLDPIESQYNSICIPAYVFLCLYPIVPVKFRKKMRAKLELKLQQNIAKKLTAEQKMSTQNPNLSPVVYRYIQYLPIIQIHNIYPITGWNPSYTPSTGRQYT